MFAQLKQRFEPILAEFLQSNSMASLTRGEMTREEYRSVMKQIFHHTRENPQLQALATVYFRGRDRDMIKMFYNHATSEIGHDQLALNDYETLGGDASMVPYENPLPATSAMLAYGFYQIYNQNPIGYLGYLFFLEFSGTGAGDSIMDALRGVGVPDNAMTFLRDHTVIDVGHNRLMEKYAAHMIKDERDLDAVVYTMKTSAYLYAQMIDAAVADAHSNAFSGWNWEELDADRVTPPARNTATIVA